MRAVTTRLVWLGLALLLSLSPGCRCDHVPPGGVSLVREGGVLHDNVRLVALAGRHVYYAQGEHGSGYRLRRIPTSGGTMSQLAEVQKAIRAIVADEEAVYFGIDGAVLRVPAGGGAAVRIHESKDVCSSAGGCGLALSEEHVYATARAGIVRIPKRGGPSQEIDAGVAEPGDAPIAVALSATHVHWIAHLKDGVFRAPRAGGAVETIATGLYPSHDPTLAVSGGHVYYLHGHSLSRVPEAGGTPELVVETGSHAGSYSNSFHIAGDTAYFTRSVAGIGAGTRRSPGPARREGEGGVMKVPVTGGEPVWVARGLEQVYSIAVDDEAVYLATDNGQIVKHPR